MLINNLFAAFLSDIVAKLRKRFFALVLLSAICAITDSLRIVVAFLLVPFIGIPLESASTGFLTRVQELFGYFNLPYTLTTVSIFVILVFLFQTVLSLFQNWYQGSYTYYYTLLWRQQLFKAVGQANWRYFLNASRGELVNALSNETGRLASATTKFLTFLSNLLVALAYVIAASLVSFKATALMVLVGFTVIIFNSLFLKRLMRHARLIVNGNTQMMQMTQEFMNNIKAVKSSPLGLSVDTLVARPLRSIFRSERVGYMIPNASRIVAELFIMLALVTAIIFVSNSADSGASADGLLVLALFLRAYSKITMTMTSAQQMYVLLPAFEHVSQIHSKAITHEEPQWETGLLPSPDALASGIDFTNVCVSHEQTLALKNITLHLPPRSIIALVGPSGAGKTTLVDALLRLVDFDSGEISIKGQSITVFNMQSWRSCFGYVSQEPTLVNGTLADNIKLFKPDATNDEVRRAAQLANAQEFIEALPEGYQTTVGEMGLKLSGGQRQRIALARALINDPPALILDEATSALDTESEDKVMHAIHEIAATKTIVLIAHRLSTVRKADLIVVLDKGEIIEQGNWESLIHHKGRLAELWQRMEPPSLQQKMSSVATPSQE